MMISSWGTHNYFGSFCNLYIFSMLNDIQGVKIFDQWYCGLVSIAHPFIQGGYLAGLLTTYNQILQLLLIQSSDIIIHFDHITFIIILLYTANNSKQPLMIEKQKRSQTLEPKPEPKRFSIQHYICAQNPQQYIEQILLLHCQHKKINPEVMNVGQFSQLINVLPISLKIKQIYEVYLYATCETGIHQKGMDRKPHSIVNLQNNKISLILVAKWINIRLAKNKLEFVEIGKKNKKYLHTNTQKSSIQKLPFIKTNPSHRFRTYLSKALNTFSQIEKERQNAGLQAVALSSDQQVSHEQPINEIHYDGDFFEVNTKINKLRSEAITYIEEMIVAAKDNKKLKKQFEESLLKYEKVRTEANEKIGRGASMKAQKRMIDNKKEVIRKLNKWKRQNNITIFQNKYL